MDDCCLIIIYKNQEGEWIETYYYTHSFRESRAMWFSEYRYWLRKEYSADWLLIEHAHYIRFKTQEDKLEFQLIYG